MRKISLRFLSAVAALSLAAPVAFAAATPNAVQHESTLSITGYPTPTPPHEVAITGYPTPTPPHEVAITGYPTPTPPHEVAITGYPTPTPPHEVATARQENIA